MKSRLLLGAAAVACASAVMLPARAAATSLLCAPAVTGVTTPGPGGHAQHYGPAGSTVTVSGEGLQSPPVCTLVAVQVGPVRIAAAAVSAAPDGSSLHFSLPAGASGPVAVVTRDTLGNDATSNANFVFIETPTAAVASATPVESSPETVSGSGFGPFLPPSAGGVPGAQVGATYTGCTGAAAVPPAAVTSATALELRSPPVYCDGPLWLDFYAPANTTLPLDCTPGAAAYNCSPVGVDAGAIDVAFFVGGVSPTPSSIVHPGDVITVTGSGFGTAGRAQLGAAAAPVSWSDHRIAVTVPAGATSGPLTVQRGQGDLAAVSVGAYIVPGTVPGGSVPPVLTSPASPGASASPSPSGAALAVTRSGIHETLSLLTDGRSATAGGLMHLVVTLTAAGKAVSGAPVTISIISAPGRDAAVTPVEGTTDAGGAFRAVLRLSRRPGTHVLLAKSGIYSAEARVVGVPAGAATTTSQGSPNAPVGVDVNATPVVAGLAITTAVLVLIGAIVNLAALRGQLWRLTVGRLLARRRSARGPA